MSASESICTPNFDVAFSAPPTGVTALFGPSGCGKSTVLAAVAGLLRPDKGRITVGETVLLDTAQGISLPPERRRCGVVFQDARLFPHLSVRQNLLYGRAFAPRTGKTTHHPMTTYRVAGAAAKS